MPKKQPKQRPLYNLYTDGSFFPNKKVMGAGWVLTKGNKDRKPKRGSAKIAGPDSSSTIAEIYAVCYGLQKIRHGARIVVYTDLQKLASCINDPEELNQWLKNTQGKASLHFALTILKDQIRRPYISVSAVDNILTKTFHREAHHLAREGVTKTRPSSSALKGIKHG